MGLVLGGMASLVLVPSRPSRLALPVENPPLVGKSAPEVQETPGPMEGVTWRAPSSEVGGLVLFPEKAPNEDPLRPFRLPGGTLLWQRNTGGRSGPAGAPVSEITAPEPVVELAPSPTLHTH